MRRYRCWLDVKMPQQDMDAMREGVEQSDCVLAIITGGDVTEHRYFERGMCLQARAVGVGTGRWAAACVLAGWLGSREGIAMSHMLSATSAAFQECM